MTLTNNADGNAAFVNDIDFSSEIIQNSAMKDISIILNTIKHFVYMLLLKYFYIFKYIYYYHVFTFFR